MRPTHFQCGYCLARRGLTAQCRQKCRVTESEEAESKGVRHYLHISHIRKAMATEAHLLGRPPSNLCSRLCLCWPWPFIFKGYANALAQQDMPQLPMGLLSSSTCPAAFDKWEVERKKTKPSVKTKPFLNQNFQVPHS